MATSTDRINAKNAYYNELMNGYRQRSKEINGRNVTHFSTEESKNKEWWNNCRIYTAIAVFVIFIVGCILVASLAATGLLI